MTAAQMANQGIVDDEDGLDEDINGNDDEDDGNDDDIDMKEGIITGGLLDVEYDGRDFISHQRHPSSAVTIRV